MLCLCVTARRPVPRYYSCMSTAALCLTAHCPVPRCYSYMCMAVFDIIMLDARSYGVKA